MQRLEGIELLRALCLEFGPTGSEDRVRELIQAQLEGVCAEFYTDRMGNLTVKYSGSGDGYDAAEPKKIMISAHMDEVGMMVRDISDDGYIKFSNLGGIDARVLCGRGVVLCGDAGLIKGVIASKAIHHQSAEERRTATPVDKMYIDIGAANREEAEKYVKIGDSATFDSDFILFGKDGRMIKSKAIDDRLGCAVMIETLRRLDSEKTALPFDLYFCFTVREEIGISGAQTTAQRIAPDEAYVLESTAIADIADVAPSSRVSEVGGGGVISLADRSTIYDRGLVDRALKLAGTHGIKAQIKRYISGGNDAGHIHKSGKGVRSLAISAPTRYLHSAACVTSVDDFCAIKELLWVLVTE